MLPRWHVFWGGVMTGVLYYASPGLPLHYLLAFFCASVFIDFDHYIQAAYTTGSFRFGDAFAYHDVLGEEIKHNHAKGIRQTYDFHLFHTLEFHALIALIGIWWSPAFYVFLGMTFHSLLDIYSMLKADVLYTREFFLTKWIITRLS